MAQSSFEVSEFMAKIDAKGSLAKRNRFSVEIKPPNTLVSDVNPADIEFLIKTVQFPGRSFGPANYRYGGKFGLEVPYEMTEEPVAITFQGTNDWSARKFWYDWLEHIQSTNSYNMQYYKEFIGTVKISVYDDTQEVASYPTHKVALMEAWPKNISSVDLGWENTEIVDFSVDVAYSWWEIDGRGSSSSTPPARPRSRVSRNSPSQQNLTTGQGPHGNRTTAQISQAESMGIDTTQFNPANR